MAAAEEASRPCYGLEIDPGYAAVVLERMSSYGIEPKKLPR
jgi:DNA modification methylase